MKLFDSFKKPKVENKLNLLPDGVFVLEHDGKIIDVNDKALELYQTTRFNVLGNYFSDFVENGTFYLNEIIQNQERIYAKSIHEESNIQPMILEISASRSPETLRIYAIVRDVTKQRQELVQYREKYNAAKKIVDEKNEFLINCSGPILSNVVSTAGFSKALLDGIGGAVNEKQTKYLNIINNNSKDLNYDLEHLFALFKLESEKVEYNFKVFDIVSLIKSIDRIYRKNFIERKIFFSLDYSKITQRDCNLDSQIVEYIIKSILDIFLKCTNLGICTLNIGHPPLDFLQTRSFQSNDSLESEKYVLFEAKIKDLVFGEDELENIFDAYYRSQTKRPIGLKASLSILKYYICAFGGDIWVYSKPDFGTMITFVLPLNKKGI